MSNIPEVRDYLESDWSSFRRIVEEQVGVTPNEEDVTKSRNAELDSAISQARELLDATPDGHTDKPDRLYSLGKQHQNRYLSFYLQDPT